MFKLIVRLISINAVLFLYQDRAYAYVDPGTGGLFYQLIILIVGAIAGYLAIFRKFFKKIFKKKDTSEKDK